MLPYDPFLRGPHPVGVRSASVPGQRGGGEERALRPALPAEVWYPAPERSAPSRTRARPADRDRFPAAPTGALRTQDAVRNARPLPGTHPLVLFSHSSGGDRRQSTFLCTHLASHGYLVAAVDHSERVAPELAPATGESVEARAARIDAMIAARVPDIERLRAWMLEDSGAGVARVDPTCVGIVGHSFGGWTALSAVERLDAFRSVVALAPAGARGRAPGTLPVELSFARAHPVPALYLVAAGDTSLPLAGMRELYGRTPAPRRMAILPRADHVHFMDGVHELHEAVRTMPATGVLALIQQRMRPASELCGEAEAHLFVRGLTLAHLDATLRERADAVAFWNDDPVAALAAHGVEASFEPE